MKLIDTIAIVLSTTVLVLAVNLYQETRVYNGVPYVFPAAQGAAFTTLTNDGAGNLSWAAAAQADIVMPVTGAACPSGWEEYTGARGRTIVGLVASGTSGGTVGTALVNVENRPVGLHSHGVTDAGHTHTQDIHGHSVASDPGHFHLISGFSSQNCCDFIVDISFNTITFGTTPISSADANLTLASTAATNISSPTSVTISNTGSGIGTNVPYLQMLFCRSVSGA